MDQNRLNQCIQALNSKGVKNPCPRCGNHKFSILGESLISIQSDPGVISLGGPGVPTIIVACENCGYVTQHAQAPLGLMGGQKNG